MNSLHPARSGFLTFDRMTTEQAAARRVIDRMRAERATASDPLPAPQQREARIVEATQAEPAPKQGDGMSEAVARVLARHRAQAAAAAGTSTPDAPAVAGDPAPPHRTRPRRSPPRVRPRTLPAYPGRAWGGMPGKPRSSADTGKRRPQPSQEREDPTTRQRPRGAPNNPRAETKAAPDTDDRQRTASAASY